MAENKNGKAKKVLGYSGLFLSIFGIAASIAFFSVPTKVRETPSPSQGTVDVPLPDVDAPSHGDLLIAKLAEAPHLAGDVNVTMTFPDKDDDPSTGNKLDLTGTLAFGMQDLDDINVKLDLTVDYNGVQKDLEATLADDGLYFSLTEHNDEISFANKSGVKYKMVGGDLDTLILNIVDIVGADSDIWDINSYVGSMDTSSMSMDSLDFSAECTSESDVGYGYDLKLDTGSFKLEAHVESDLEYNLTKLEIADIAVGDVHIGVEMNTGASSTAGDFKPVGNKDDYLSFVSSWDLIKKTYDLVEAKKFGVSLNATLTHDYSTAEKEQYEDLDLSASINADLDKSIYNVAANISNEVATEDGTTTYTKTLAAGYQEDSIFFNYNDIFKASLNTTTLGELIGKIQDDMSDKDASSMSDLLDFVSEGDLINEIKDGHYQGVIELLKYVHCEDNKIEIAVALDDLGLGSESEVVVTLNAQSTATSLAAIAVNNAKFSDFELNATLQLEDYEAKTFEIADYPEITKLVNIYDQFYTVAQAKKAGLALEGSITGTGDYLGFDFSAETQFDTVNEVGNAYLNVVEHDAKFGDINHDLTIDVDGREDMKFNYQTGPVNGNSLKGKFKFQTLKDIVGLVMDVLNDDDPKITKFTGSLTEMSMDGIIADIQNGNYFSLLQANILKSATVNEDGGMTFIINAADFGFNSDITLDIKRTVTGELDYLRVQMDVNGTGIDVKASLVDYDDENVQRLTAISEDQFWDFSQIKDLIDCFYTTAKLESFHLTADLKVKVGSIVSVLDIPLDFYVFDSADDVKVYGTAEIPLRAGLNTSNITSWISGAKRYITFIYTNDYFYLHRRDKISSIITAWNKEDSYRMTQDYFLDNIADVLINYVLGLDAGLIDIDSLMSDSERTAPIQYDEMITKFQYTESSHMWNMGLDVGELAGNDALGTADITFTANDADILSTLALKLDISIINIDGSFENKNPGGDNWTSDVESKWSTYIAAHIGDTLNAIV